VKINFTQMKRDEMRATCAERGIKIIAHHNYFSLRAPGIDVRVIDLKFLNAADLEPEWLPARPSKQTAPDR
jgi:hypothetical protein